MTTGIAIEGAPSRHLGRSTAAVAAGFIVVVALSLGTDQVLHVLQVYPPWGEPMYDPGLNLLALAYRCVYSVLGTALAARLAHRNPMRHALALGIVGLIVSALGTLAAFTADLGPVWYPLALVIVALPCAWLGGAIARRRVSAP
jgi:hypothetical protein